MFEHIHKINLDLVSALEWVGTAYFTSRCA